MLKGSPGPKLAPGGPDAGSGFCRHELMFIKFAQGAGQMCSPSSSPGRSLPSKGAVLGREGAWPEVEVGRAGKSVKGGRKSSHTPVVSYPGSD